MTRARGIWQGEGFGHVAGCGGMWQRWWQGVGACCRGYGYVVWGQAYGMDGDVAGVGACGRVLGHVTGCGVMWQGVEAWHKG